ncbi:MAG: hypothetical protein EXS18_01250 [Verrucomicrobiae bacterium]|nr:hypothetical protein [Verrucomicrobiae bacterium]
MKARYWIGIATIAIAAAATVWADSIVIAKTFRTTARIYAVIQGTDGLTGKPQYDLELLAGHDLVNLALGTSLDTARSNEVLALEVDCASTQASLVVYDKAADSNIAVIATSSSFDTVQQQDDPTAGGANRERFVAEMDIQAGGDATNGLLDGKLMVSGRLHLNPNTGCPRAIPVKLDKDKLDKQLGDIDFKDSDDTDRIVLRAGHGHAIGVLDIVTDGTTNKVLVPHMQLSIRRSVDTQPD